MASEDRSPNVRLLRRRRFLNLRGVFPWKAVRFKVVLCQAKHFALVAVHQLAGGFGERNPERAFHFDPHFGSHVVNVSRAIAQ